MSAAANAVIYSTECKEGCGVLEHRVPSHQLEEDNSGYRWVKCKACGNINKVTE